MQFDPEHPEAMSVRALVDVGSLETHNPATDYDFNAIVSGDDLLNAPAHPQATFVSIKVEVTGTNTANVAGNLTLNGGTSPDALPKLTIIPIGRKASSEPMKVSLPTES